MLLLIMAFCDFLLAVFLHRFEYVSKQHFKTLVATAMFFFSGFFINLGLLLLISRLLLTGTFTIWTIPLYGTASLFFLLWIGLYLIFLTGVYLQDVSPAAKMYHLIHSHKNLSQKQLQSYFSYEKLVGKRIKEMKKSNLMYGEKNRYYLDEKGVLVYRLLHLYQQLIGWKTVF